LTPRALAIRLMVRTVVRSGLRSMREICDCGSSQLFIKLLLGQPGLLAGLGNALGSQFQRKILGVYQVLICVKALPIPFFQVSAMTRLCSR